MPWRYQRNMKKINPDLVGISTHSTFFLVAKDIDGVSLKGFNQWHVGFNHRTQKYEKGRE